MDGTLNPAAQLATLIVGRLDVPSLVVYPVGGIKFDSAVRRQHP